MCLTSGHLVSLTLCAGKDSDQQFTLEKNGNLHLKAQKESCVALLTGEGPALTMAACKAGNGGANEEFTFTNGQLCSNQLGGRMVCLKPESSKPSGGGGHHGVSSGFGCGDDDSALARCRVHMTMWYAVVS